MSIGERIAELRKQQNISQAQLAEDLSITRQAVSKWENDLAVPDALKMIHLAEILDTDIEYLSTGRMNLGRRPPVVLTEVKVVEKIIEKPIIQEIAVEKIVEKAVVQIVEKPIDRPVYRVKYKYRRNPREFLVFGTVCFILGVLAGVLLR